MAEHKPSFSRHIYLPLPMTSSLTQPLGSISNRPISTSRKAYNYSLERRTPILYSSRKWLYYKQNPLEHTRHSLCQSFQHSTSSITMENSRGTPTQKNLYSVWGLPPEEVTPRLKKLMEGLRSEFGGPQFEPHVTVVGAISLTEDEARDRFKTACEGVKAYDVSVAKVDRGSLFYQCVYLLLHPAPQVVEASDHCCNHFGYERPTPYMPHLSLLYEHLTDEEKKKAQEKAYILDESIDNLSFRISRLALYKTDTEDETLESWEKVAECDLN